MQTTAPISGGSPKRYRIVSNVNGIYIKVKI